ncbi:hypothetical protein ACFE04_027653 [Oxalis oulophora]
MAIFLNLHLVLPLLFLSLMFFIPAWSDEKSTDALIEKICRNNEDYGFCTKVFRENMKSPSTDIVGLARITIDQASENATNTLGYVNYRTRQVTDPQIKFLLSQCTYGYDEVRSSFTVASEFLNERQYSKVVGIERTAPYAIRNCLSAFATTTDPIGQRNTQMRILITMAIVTAFNLDMK